MISDRMKGTNTSSSSHQRGVWSSLAITLFLALFGGCDLFVCDDLTSHLSPDPNENNSYVNGSAYSYLQIQSEGIDASTGKNKKTITISIDGTSELPHATFSVQDALGPTALNGFYGGATTTQTLTDVSFYGTKVSYHLYDYAAFAVPVSNIALTSSTISDGSIEVTQDGGQYTLRWNFTIDTGYEFRGTYTGPLGAKPD